MVSAELLIAFREVESSFTTFPNHVPDLISKQSFDLTNLKDHLSDPNGRPYGRKVLYHGKDLEVVLVNWAPFNTCLPHAHGESIGFVRVLTGTIINRVFEYGPRRPVLSETQIGEVGSFVGVT